jgi:hypothetical protein
MVLVLPMSKHSFQIRHYDGPYVRCGDPQESMMTE